MRKMACTVALALLPLTSLSAQVFRDVFPPEEFVARRAKVMAKIGDGVVIAQGASEVASDLSFRQSNQFHYLTGVVEPRAILVIDGRSKRTTLFLYPYNERREHWTSGPGLYPGDSAAKVTGTDAVMDRADFGKMLEGFARDGRTIYTFFHPEVLAGSSQGSMTLAYVTTAKADPWDGRPTREDNFIQKLKSAAPKSEVRGLDGIVDTLRFIKSPREIAMVREASRIAALGLMEAMRDARPGMYEYQLQADAVYQFKYNGSYGDAYFAIAETGFNTGYIHYDANTAQLKDGDLVKLDYAPDFKNYASDVTRVFPANGKWTAWQREYYTVYLRLYQAVITSIKPYILPKDVIKDALVKMDAFMASHHFTDPAIRAAAQEYIDRYRNNTNIRSLGHGVGMEVHDVRRAADVLMPGEIFAVEPAMPIKDQHLEVRNEDVVLVTETGYENLSALAPVEPDDIEKLMKEPGLSDAMVKAARRTIP